MNPVWRSDSAVNSAKLATLNGTSGIPTRGMTEDSFPSTRAERAFAGSLLGLLSLPPMVLASPGPHGWGVGLVELAVYLGILVSIIS